MDFDAMVSLSSDRQGLHLDKVAWGRKRMKAEAGGFFVASCFKCSIKK